MSNRLRVLVPALLLAAAAFIASGISLLAPAAGSGATASSTVVRLPRPPERPHVTKRKQLTLGERVAKIALREVGVPYRWGGESPTGFDCSGLVRWSYLRVGIDLPHSSYALYSHGRRVARGRMKPGDVLFFDGLGHVGLYVGRGRMVHAPYSGRDVEVVRLADWYRRRLIGARRLVTA
jgi:cell wall-associated NlpC family hydrolase